MSSYSKLHRQAVHKISPFLYMEYILSVLLFGSTSTISSLIVPTAEHQDTIFRYRGPWFMLFLVQVKINPHFGLPLPFRLSLQVWVLHFSLPLNFTAFTEHSSTTEFSSNLIHANQKWYQVKWGSSLRIKGGHCGCGGEAPARFSEHCLVLSLIRLG